MCAVLHCKHTWHHTVILLAHRYSALVAAPSCMLVQHSPPTPAAVPALLVCTSSTCRMRGPNQTTDTFPTIHTYPCTHAAVNRPPLPALSASTLACLNNKHRSLRYQKQQTLPGAYVHIYTHTFKHRLPPKASHPAPFPPPSPSPQGMWCESQQQELPDSRQDVLPQQQLVYVQDCAHMKKWSCWHISLPAC
jgi:hypothetical protein